MTYKTLMTTLYIIGIVITSAIFHFLFKWEYEHAIIIAFLIMSTAKTEFLLKEIYDSRQSNKERKREKT